jgi:hypothetical protein
LLQTLNANL